MKEEIRSEIESFAPILSKLENTGKFEVPEGYFDSLPGLIQNRISEEKSQFELIDFFREFFNLRIAVPAFVMLIAIGAGWYFDNLDSIPNSEANNISYEYLSNSVYFEDFEDEVLFDELLADNFTGDLSEGGMFSNREIEEYLLNAQFDETIILNEL